MGTPLRAEALPRPQHKLTKSQQKAANRLLDTLQAQLAELDEIKDEPGKLDRDRRNRLLFWSGAPGVGKSSTYLSVRSWVEDKTDCQDHVGKPRPIHDLNRRVRWLEALDLEPLSGQPNFLAAVLARIDDALGAQRDADGEWTIPRDPGFLVAQEHFQRLKTDIALSWEGNLQSRGGSLEPDVYAQEVMLAERARLNVNLRFRQVIGKLASYISARRGEPGLFVLPIDDLYLKPHITVELLRFLRMISSPHLFVLVMGDMDVVKDLMFLHSIGEASQLMASGGAAILDQASKQRIIKRSSALAISALNKLIAPSQRTVIDTMKPAEVVEYQVPPGRRLGALLGLESTLKGCTDAESSCNKVPFLSKVLNDWIGGHKPLEPPKDDPDDDMSLGGRLVAPWLLDALQMSARHVADIYPELQKLATDKPDIEAGKSQEQLWRPAIFVTEQLERALLEHSELGHEDARAIVTDCSTGSSYYARRFPQSVKFRPESETPTSGFVRLFYQAEQATRELSAMSIAWLAILYDLLREYEKDQTDLKLPDLPNGVRTFRELWEATRSVARSEPTELTRLGANGGEDEGKKS